MPTFSAKPIENKCPACNGTGFLAVAKQPAQPGRRIYPPRCLRCEGKGWVAADN
jgi:DnaJ-class molecular chaperone